MQEAVLAKGMFVLCGDRTLVRSVIEDFAERIMKIWPAVLYQHAEAVDGIDISGFVSILQIRQWRALLPNESLTFLRLFCPRFGSGRLKMLVIVFMDSWHLCHTSSVMRSPSVTTGNIGTIP
jgi:hypothetical protein